jgi:hypothetical protein
MFGKQVFRWHSRSSGKRTETVTMAISFAIGGESVEIICPTEDDVKIHYDILKNWLRHYDGFTANDEYFVATHSSGGLVRIVTSGGKFAGLSPNLD